ncbi:MAG: hypothetical protein HC782_01320 [Gammaproteobacteria bacterium]|nr:hypothetical protein [Gammaproteobacteria bacterium]
MVHDMPAPAQSGSASHGPFVNQIKEFLLRNYARDLTLAEIAWHVRKSEEHVAREGLKFMKSRWENE